MRTSYIWRIYSYQRRRRTARNIKYKLVPGCGENPRGAIDRVITRSTPSSFSSSARNDRLLRHPSLCPSSYTIYPHAHTRLRAQEFIIGKRDQSIDRIGKKKKEIELVGIDRTCNIFSRIIA